ncbi:hypothetical protein K2Q02_01555 [Patescibacteria group bacterium]|nr:hypothetical protein [Patescibacteria group bacterium]
MKLYDVIRKEQLENKNTKESVVEIHTPEYSGGSGINYTPFEKEVRRSSWKTIFVFAGAILFIALLYVLGMKFVYARVTVLERHIPFSFDRMQLDMEEYKSAGAGRLSFQVMVVESEVTRQVYASALTASNTKSSGNIVLFNEYSTKAITIKKGTTVTSSTGKKYSTQAAITVPGYTTVNKVKKAGTSVQVQVLAVDVGESYNAEGESFSIAGYNSKQFYGRSAGAITGGEAGIAHILTDEDKESAILTLQADLAEKLKRETRAAIGAIKEEYVTFPNLQFITIDRDSLTIKGDDIKFPASIKGTMVSYLIDRDMLESAIASKVVSDRVYTSVAIPALGDITVEPISAIPTDATKIPDTLTISLSGTATLITKAPLEKIKQAVLGVPRKSFLATVQSVPEIQEARYTLYPFWAPFFPSNQERITVVVE